MKKILRTLGALPLCALLVLAIKPAVAADVIVSADIDISTTWTADNTYILDSVIYVKNGATLSIEPGTVIRGEGESSAGANDPGTLVITRGSKIHAPGTALKPIVFTNEDDDNLGSNPGSFPYDDQANALSITGTWGGVVLLGRGYVSNNTLAGPDASREIQVEGLIAASGLGLYGNCSASALFPGDCDDDDSGTMNYVSIRYGGFNLSANNEINGLTLGAVGRETDIDYIEIFQNKDDGIEYFGGTAQIKHAIVANVGDDSFDYDEGWRGKMQYAFSLQGTPGADKSDKGGEHDGGNSPDGSQPFAIPTVYNATYIGHGGNGAPGSPVKGYSDKGRNSVINMRDNAGGRYYNSFFGDFGGYPLLIEGSSSTATAVNSSGERAITPFTPNTGNCSLTTAQSCGDGLPVCPGGEECVLHQVGPDSTFQLEYEDNTWWCLGGGNEMLTGVCVGGTNAGADCLDDGECTGGGDCDGRLILGDKDSSNKIGYDPGVFGTCSDNSRGCDSDSDCAGGATCLANSLDNQYLDCAAALPIRDLARGLNPNPSLPDQVFTIDPRTSSGSPLNVTNRQAPADGFFEAVPYRGAFGSENWAEGWSTLSRLGYFPPKTQVLVSNDVDVSTLWTSDNEYVLDTVIYVKNGATLTIEPGTVIRSQPESSSGANDPGSLVISRGSKISALGTADAPIVFTNMDDSNVGNSPGYFPYDDRANALSITGTWGGVILLGRGYVANNTLTGPNAAREIQVEGLIATGGLGLYGNCAGSALFPSDCDDDDNGSMSYISIRYGGFNLSANNEINGLTLGAVGRETDMNFIEVFQNKDDGVEYFGGTSQIKNAIVANVGDDSFDYDEGWRGNMQFVFALQGTPGADKSDKGGEHDGGNSPDGSQPFAIPTVYNATYIGHGGNGATGSPVKGYSDKGRNSVVNMRDNAGGRYYNSFFGDFGGYPLLIEGSSSTATAANSSGERASTSYQTNTGNCSVTTSQSCGLGLPACPGGEECVPHYLGAGDPGFQLEYEDNTWWCLGGGNEMLTGVCVGGTNGGADCLADAECTGGGDCDGRLILGDKDASNKIGFDPGVFGTCSDNSRGCDSDSDCSGGATCLANSLDNEYLGCAAPTPIRSLVRGANPNPSLPDQVFTIDPRLTGSSPLNVTNRTAPGGFFTPAAYRGAFNGNNWASGWSNLSRLGYFPSCDPGVTDVVPDEVPNLQVDIAGSDVVVSWDQPDLQGGMGIELVDLLRSTSADDFTGSTFIKTDTADTLAVDSTIPAPGEVQFYLVRSGNACGEGSLGRSTDGVERSAP